MGRVRTKTVKRAGRQIVEKYHNKLTCDFQVNKKIADEVAMIPSKRLRNKIAGFVTHLMKRVKKGSVRGISLAVQQAERERRMDIVPDVSVTEMAGPTPCDYPTSQLLKKLKVGFAFDQPPDPEQPAKERRNNRVGEKREAPLVGMQ